jgi:hypothetical protein
VKDTEPVAVLYLQTPTTLALTPTVAVSAAADAAKAAVAIMTSSRFVFMRSSF